MDVKRHFNQLVTDSACLVLVCPSLTNLMVSVDVKHHVYLLTCSTSPTHTKSVIFATECKATASRNNHVTIATKSTASVLRISGVVIATRSTASVPRISGVVIAIKSRLHQLHPQAILMSLLPPKVHHLSLHTIQIIIIVAIKNTPPTAPNYTDNYHSRYRKYITYSSRQ